MKTIAISLVVALTSSAFGTPVPAQMTGAAGAAALGLRYPQKLPQISEFLPYELRANKTTERPDRVGFALLHGLLGWKWELYNSRTNPQTAAQWKLQNEAEQRLLAKIGISVEMLPSEQERADLSAALEELRGEFFYGTKSLKESQLLDYHKRLIGEVLRRYPNQIKLSEPSKTGPSVQITPVDELQKTLKGQQALIGGLQAALNRMKAAHGKNDTVEFGHGIADFNVALEKAGRPERLDAKKDAQSTFAQALGLYEKEHKNAAELAAKVNQAGGSAAAAALEDDTQRWKAYFDGELSKTEAERRKPAGGDTGGQVAALTGLAGEKPAAAVVVPAPETGVGADKSGKKDEEKGKKKKPGFFGMLGSLFKGIFRTVTRVASAAFKGIVGVGKALFS